MQAFHRLTPEAVRAAVRRAGFSEAVRDVRLPGQGLNNRTHLIALESGRRLAVKIRPGDTGAGAAKLPVTDDNPFWPHHTRALFGAFPNGDLDTLPRVTALLREHGRLRVPELYLADASGEVLPAPYTVSEFLEGDGCFAFVTDPLTPRAAHALGAHLAVLHAATAGRAHGPGIFERPGDHPASAWWPRFAAAYQMLFRDLARRSAAMRELERPLASALAEAVATGTPDAFPLVCVDNAPTHYLRCADGGGIAGMVDVEGHLWAPAEYELAMVDLWVGAQRRDFWDGYAAAAGGGPPAALPAVRDACQWMTWMAWIHCDYTLADSPDRARHMEVILARMCAASKR